jgi:hypothetical protein
MPARKWPPPGFPLVQGDYGLTATWTIHLPEQFARRVEDGSLVLWRPGLTVWMNAWNNDHDEPQAERLARIKDSVSPMRLAEQESSSGGVTRFSYRLSDENEDGPVEALFAFVINDEGHLQVAVYFDDPSDVVKARQLVDNVRLG